MYVIRYIMCRAKEGYEEILTEEFEDYFDGRITKELLISHLQNRVDLYLAEHDD